MTEYEHLISDAPIHSNFYPYGDATGLTPQQLYFAILVEETCNRLGFTILQLPFRLSLAGLCFRRARNWLEQQKEHPLRHVSVGNCSIAT